MGNVFFEVVADATAVAHLIFILYVVCGGFLAWHWPRTIALHLAAVDTGWITDERPHYTKMRLADEGFHAPLDLVDGAARVYDPIVQGEQGVDLHGCFLKDYEPSPW